MKHRNKTALSLLALLVATVALGQKPQVVQKKTVTVRAAAAATTAHSATLTWTAPTTCTDGSPCTPTGYAVYRSNVTCPSAGIPANATDIANNISGTMYVDNTITVGSWCYYVLALLGTQASSASNTAGGTISQSPPAAPTNFSVTVQ